MPLQGMRGQPNQSVIPFFIENREKEMHLFVGNSADEA